MSMFFEKVVKVLISFSFKWPLNILHNEMSTYVQLNKKEQAVPHNKLLYVTLRQYYILLHSITFYSSPCISVRLGCLTAGSSWMDGGWWVGSAAYKQSKICICVCAFAYLYMCIFVYLCLSLYICVFVFVYLMDCGWWVGRAGSGRHTRREKGLEQAGRGKNGQGTGQWKRLASIWATQATTFIWGSHLSHLGFGMSNEPG